MQSLSNSLHYVPTIKHFKLLDRKKDLQTFIERYIRSQNCRITDVTYKEVLKAAHCEPELSKMIEDLGSRYVKKLVVFELEKEKLSRLNLVTDKLFTESLEQRQDLLDSFSSPLLISIICDLNLDNGEKIDSLFNERAELEVYRFLMNEPPKYDFFDILRRDYELWLRKNLPSMIPKVYEHYDVELNKCSEKPLELEKLIDELSTSDLSEKVEELACRVEAEAKPPNFSCLSYPDRKVLIYSPNFTLSVKRNSTVIVTMILCLQIFGSCSSTFSNYRYRSSLNVSEIIVNPDASESRVRHCIRYLYKDFTKSREDLSKCIRVEKRNNKSIKRDEELTLPLDFTGISSDKSEDSSPKKNSSPKIKGMFSSPRLRRITSPKRLVKGSHKRTHSSHLSYVKNRKRVTVSANSLLINTTKSSGFQRKLSSKRPLKTFKDLSREIDALIPHFIGSLQAYQENDLIDLINEKLQGFEHLSLHPKYEKKVNEKVKRFLHYQKDIEDLIQNFLYIDKDTYELSRVCSLPLMEQLKDDNLTLRLFSENICRRLLGRKHPMIPDSEKLRRLLQRIFYKIYEAGYQNFIKCHSATKEDLLMISELEARRLLCQTFRPIQLFIFPYILEEDRQRIVLNFSTLFPNLNQQEVSGGSISSASGEFLIMECTVKSQLSKKDPVVTARIARDVLILKHDHCFHLIRNSEENPFAKLVFSDWTVRNFKREEWMRYCTIKSLKFVYGASLEQVEFVIKCLRDATHKCRHQEFEEDDLKKIMSLMEIETLMNMK